MRSICRSLTALSLVLLIQGSSAAQTPPAPSRPAAGAPSGNTRTGRLLLTRLNVRDLDASLRFFSEGLGLKEVSRFSPSKGTAEVSLGDPAHPLPSTIMLVHRESRTAPYSPGEWGTVVMEVRDVKLTADAVARAGGKVIRAPAGSAAAPVIVAFVADPDGHEFELVQFK
ncbi:MAG: VOC family protein [Vicinamibacterales bacterium]